MTDRSDGEATVGDAIAPAAADPPAELFARRRAELGLSLEDVANQLKFSARQIEALEAGDFARLPGGTFARGMIRSYARLLRIEPELIHEQLSAAGGSARVALEQAVSLRTPIPFSEGGNHINLVYAVLSVMLLAVVAFFAFQWYQEKSGAGKLAFVRPAVDATGSAPRSVPPPRASGAPALPPLHPEGATFASAGPAAIAETAPSGAEQSTANGAAPGGAPEANAAAGAATSNAKTAALANATPAASSNAAAAALAGTAPSASTSPPPTAVTSAGPGKRRILLHFDRQSWVEIKAAKGAILMSQLNPAGTERVVEGDPPFELTIGNATGVRLQYNDQTIDLRPYFHVDVARLTLN